MNFHAPSHARTQAAGAEAFYQEYICNINRFKANSSCFLLLLSEKPMDLHVNFGVKQHI